MKHRESSPIKFNKNDDVLNIEIKRINRGDINNIIEINTGKNEELRGLNGLNEFNEQIVPIQEAKIRIAPQYIRDYKIKKPDNEEPSFIKLIVSKISKKNADKSNLKLHDDNKVVSDKSKKKTSS